MTVLRRFGRAMRPERVLLGVVIAVAAVALADPGGGGAEHPAPQPPAASADAGGQEPGARSPQPSAVPTDSGDDGRQDPPMPPAVPADAQPARVVNVVDGDTINVEPTGPGPLSTTAAHTVRLLLVDTPETVHPTQPVGCFGQEASAFVTDTLLGATVWLEADEQDTDRYGRFLRHVWLQDGTNLNLELVERGYADAVLYEPNDRYWSRFADAAGDAERRDVGLWGACPRSGPDAGDAPRRAADVQVPGPGADGVGCDASYPGICVPPPPPDLDCGAIDQRRFAVAGADPHGFDGDGDGIGCEGG